MENRANNDNSYHKIKRHVNVCAPQSLPYRLPTATLRRATSLRHIRKTQRCLQWIRLPAALLRTLLLIAATLWTCHAGTGHIHHGRHRERRLLFA
jgi:hypothetical protein